MTRFEGGLIVPRDPSQADQLKELLPIEIGILGGSGNYDPAFVENTVEVKVYTPYGNPSDFYVLGTMRDKKVAFLARHGRGHKIPPHKINYRANIWGFKTLGVKRIIASSACGILQPEKIKVGEFVIADQIFDRTFGQRADTFFDGGVVAHVSFKQPFCPELRKIIIDTAKEIGYKVHEQGTYVAINGPRFSTTAESLFYHKMGFDIIGMTAYPEAILAREAELCYALIALPTDTDIHEEEEVSVEVVIQNMQKNVERVRKLLYEVIPNIPIERNCKCGQALEAAYF